MKITFTQMFLTLALCAGAAQAAEPARAPVRTKALAPAPREADVQKDIDSIVANCEKKKLPTEQEIECIEQGFLQFMGETPQGGS